MTNITIMKKKASSVLSKAEITLCKTIEAKPATTIIHNFFQLNKNKFLEFIIFINCFKN